MTPMTRSQIAELHAARTAKGRGYADSLADCIEAARLGLLFDVDTRNAGEDSLIVADSPDDAVEAVADCHGSEGWTAERITLDEGE
jgi:hypothetical protein